VNNFTSIQNFSVNKEQRQQLNGHRSFVLWFTGLSGSGKSTLANQLEKKLFADGFRTIILDGDNIRNGLNKNLGFSDEDRTENIRRIAEVSKLFVDAGVIVITAFISPFIKNRDFAKNIMQHNEFFEIYIDCPIEECLKRDVKGLYAKAQTGEIKNFTGLDSSYEKPLAPDLIVNTCTETIDVCVKKIYNLAKQKAALRQE
jgi:adenylyl-sulfate kinase